MGFTDIAALLAAQTQTPPASSYAEAAAVGMGMLLAVCAAVWFVIKLMNDPLRERLEKVEKQSHDSELAVTGLEKETENTKESQEKLEASVNDKLERLVDDLDKIDIKIDALTKAVNAK